MIKINKMIVSGNFKYLWLKSVHNVDLNEHCAKSLIGRYSRIINNDIYEVENLKLDLEPAPVYYLCGVSDPYVYDKNFHLAFMEKEGSILEVERNGIKIILENAEEIPFSIKDVNFELEQSNKKSYYTCRNWQFANKFKKGEI